jgi:putative ABC transport system permease protein
MWRDLRHAAAGLWRSPLFTLTAVAALGLAIGANATIFSLVDGLWFRPPGVRDPGRLVWIYSTDASDQNGPWSYAEYEALRDGARSFSAVLARGRRGTTMVGPDGTSELLLVNVVTTNFFQALGIEPAAGRLFAPGDEASLERDPVILLGHSFWRRRFGGDASIVGRTVQLSRGSGVSVVVAGVLPEAFRELDADADRDIWMPPQTWMRLENRETFARRTDRWFDVLAVRAAGISTVRQTQPELDALTRQLALAYPETNTGRGARAVSHFQRQVENGGTNALALLGLVLLVVVITCVNVANLLFARGVARSRELAVRAALGATRRRLIRELLAECLLLGAAGAFAGLTLALWLIRIIPTLLTAPPGFRSFTVFQADGRVLLFTFIVTLMTTFLFGVTPSWWTARADVAALIKGGGTAANPRVDGRLGRLLTIGQVALSLVLLTAAAALTRSFVEITRADIGVTSPNVLTAWTSGGSVAASHMPETRVALERLATLPGVTRTAVAFRAPLSLSGGGIATPLRFPERSRTAGEAPLTVKFNAVSRDYFAVLGLRLVEGRLFDLGDDEAAGEPVVIVNQAFVARYFAGHNGLNARVQLGAASEPHRIVGIVGNAAINSVTEPPEPYLYLPYWRGDYGEATFLLQSASDAAPLAPVVRTALRRIHPALEPRRLVTMREYIDFSGSTYRATAALATVLGGVGLVLTMLGIYGVIAYRTARRVREIGIRMAVGARRLDVLRLVAGEGALVAVAGIGVGIPAAVVGTHQIAAMLFRVNPADVWILGTAAGTLFVSVCAAALIPAWRATRVEPFDALRTS